jgi:hypothetical protein
VLGVFKLSARLDLNDILSSVFRKVALDMLGVVLPPLIFSGGNTLPVSLFPISLICCDLILASLVVVLRTGLTLGSEAIWVSGMPKKIGIVLIDTTFGASF